MQATTYVTIYHGKNVSDHTQMEYFKKFVDFIVLISGKNARPKCLGFYFHDEPANNHFFETFFKYAWSKKILDFTVINLNSSRDITHPTMHYFNPFHDISINKRFGSRDPIFPDKLENANGYPLKLYAMNHPPYITSVKDDAGNVKQIDTDFLVLLEVTAWEMNFWIKFVEVEAERSLQNAFREI